MRLHLSFEPFRKKLSSTKGFTLTELMIAALATTTIISASGWGLVNMTQLSRSSNAESERRVELNRSLDFISTEVREATEILQSALPSEFSPSATEVVKSTVQPALQLRIRGLPRPVIYYLASPAPSNKTWLGPKVVYRWGPDFAEDGSYKNETNLAAWKHQPVIDSINDKGETPQCDQGNPSDPTDNWKPIPSSGQLGFYACVDPTQRIAKLHHNGIIRDYADQQQGVGQDGKPLMAANSNNRIYKKNEKVYARSSDYTFFNIVGGQLVFTNKSDVTFQVLGSDIRCGASGTPMLTQAQIALVRPGGNNTNQTLIVDPAGIMPTLSYNNEAPGTSIDFTGNIKPSPNSNNVCNARTNSGNGFNSVSHPQQVKVLKDGDVVPNLAAFGGGSTIEDYVKNYIDSNGKIFLPEPQRQAIVIHELGVTDSSSSAFDMQDLVVLVTVNPL